MLAEEFLLPVGQAIKHLCRALIVSYIGYLISICLLLNLENEGRQVVLGHL